MKAKPPGLFIQHIKNNKKCSCPYINKYTSYTEEPLAALCLRKYRKVGDPYHIFLEMTEIFWECVKEKIDTKILKKQILYYHRYGSQKPLLLAKKMIMIDGKSMNLHNGTNNCKATALKK